MRRGVGESGYCAESGGGAGSGKAGHLAKRRERRKRGLIHDGHDRLDLGCGGLCVDVVDCRCGRIAAGADG
jgi:hypothetical protein